MDVPLQASIRKTYRVTKVENPDAPQAISHDALPWNLAVKLDDFSYPWEREKAPLLEFRAIHDDTWLYCSFQVVDDEIRVYRSRDTKNEVVYGDRVEIFFAQDLFLKEYYCLEIDPYARLYDYRASLYRKFDDVWSWPSEEIAVKSEFSGAGYHVTLMLSIRSLKNFGLIHNDKILAGIFRGKCTEIDLEHDKMRWISWVKPDSSHPDFHIPSSFGEFQLNEYPGRQQ